MNLCYVPTLRLVYRFDRLPWARSRIHRLSFFHSSPQFTCGDDCDDIEREMVRIWWTQHVGCRHELFAPDAHVCNACMCVCVVYRRHHRRSPSSNPKWNAIFLLLCWFMVLFFFWLVCVSWLEELFLCANLALSRLVNVHCMALGVRTIVSDTWFCLRFSRPHCLPKLTPLCMI